MTSQPTSAQSVPPPQGNGNLRFLLGAVLIAAAVAWLAFTSFEEQVFYYTVGEAIEMHEELVEREFRIKGDVVPGSHMVREGTLDEHLFRIIDGEYAIDVHFRGILPDTFSDEAEVIALGRMNGPELFEAVEVMAKCASRYDGVPPGTGGAAGSPFIAPGATPPPGSPGASTY
ncbi:MAG: cytochrome c maturation protein CcmE [Deltaproteobacteria bacterium]|nr:MAG: cytochrome c maturation protein CcmE [Deltaproteobacteria bacterium]